MAVIMEPRHIRKLGWMYIINTSINYVWNIVYKPPCVTDI